MLAGKLHCEVMFSLSLHVNSFYPLNYCKLIIYCSFIYLFINHLFIYLFIYLSILYLFIYLFRKYSTTPAFHFHNCHRPTFNWDALRTEEHENSAISDNQRIGLHR